MHIRTRAIVVYIFQALFAVLGFTYVGVKFAISTPFNVSIHYTNWGWIAIVFFMWVELVAYADELVDRAWNIAFLPVVWAISWTVAILAIPLLYLNPGLITENTHEPGIALVFDRVLHVLPALIVIVYVTSRTRQLRHLFDATRDREGGVSPWWVVYYLAVAPVLPVVIYSATVDIPNAYGVDVPEIAIVAGMILTGLLLNWVLVAVVYDAKPFYLALYSDSHELRERLE